MSTYFEKNHNTLTVRGGGGGVNPYGQPDRKKTVFFLDDFPKDSHTLRCVKVSNL